MKKLLLAVLVGLFSLTAYSQDKLALIFETNYSSKWDKSLNAWGEFDQVHAHFDLYKDVKSGVPTRIIAYMNSSNDYDRGITFYVYKLEYENKPGGKATYYYVNLTKELAAGKANNNSLYIKITDEIDGQVPIIELSGYKPDKWNWAVRDIIKK
jgi:hypothetical protein